MEPSLKRAAQNFHPVQMLSKPKGVKPKLPADSKTTLEADTPQSPTLGIFNSFHARHFELLNSPAIQEQEALRVYFSVLDNRTEESKESDSGKLLFTNNPATLPTTAVSGQLCVAKALRIRHHKTSRSPQSRHWDVLH